MGADCGTKEGKGRRGGDDSAFRQLAKSFDKFKGILGDSGQLMNSLAWVIYLQLSLSPLPLQCHPPGAVCRLLASCPAVHSVSFPSLRICLKWCQTRSVSHYKGCS